MDATSAGTRRYPASMGMPLDVAKRWIAEAVAHWDGHAPRLPARALDGAPGDVPIDVAHGLAAGWNRVSRDAHLRSLRPGWVWGELRPRAPGVSGALISAALQVGAYAFAPVTLACAAGDHLQSVAHAYLDRVERAGGGRR